jgi:AraC family transcriptional regulator, dual regulator of chb operon
MTPVKRWAAFADPSGLFRPVRDLYTARRPMLLHTHEYAEITCINQGQALHRLNGAEMPMVPGDLVFIRASDVHHIIPAGSEPMELTNVAVHRDALRSLSKRYPREIEWAFRPREMSGTSASLDPLQQRRFHGWVDELFLARRDVPLPIDRFVLNLLTELMPHREAESIPPEAPDWLVNAWKEIQRPENFPRGVTAFFRLAGRSREHAARALHLHFKITPTECVLRARMKYAARQLEMSTRPILDISLDCGFRDLAHFYKVFRHHYGSTPRAYRLARRI